MVGVGVVEAYDVEAEATRLTLDLYQLLRGDVVAVVGGVGTGVAGTNDLLNVIYRRGAIAFARDVLAEQDAAALVGVSLFAMGAEGFVVSIVDT